MPKHFLRSRLTLSLLALSMAGATQAAPPAFQDTRAMGMGGTGVAAARPASAAYFNPALLAAEHGRGHNNFALTLPSFNARFADSEDVPEEIDNIQDTIRLLEENPSQEGAGTLADQLEALDSDTLRGDLALGFNVARPGQELGLGFHMTGRLRATVQGNVSDDDIASLRSIESGDINPIDFNTDQLESRGRVMATGVLESGISFATQRNIAGERIAVGVTPKYMQLRTFDYIENVDDFDDDDFDASEYETSKSGFNLDIGAAMQFGERDQWRFGASVRNLIPMTLKARERSADVFDPTAERPELKIRPQVTLGVAHTSNWHTLTADLDLTRTHAFGPEAETQFLSVGGEINLIDWVNLRGGIRQNLASNTGADGIEEKTQFTAGLALSPWALRIELAAMVSDDEIGAGAELGVAF